MVEIRNNESLANPRVTFALTDTVKAALTSAAVRFLRWLHEEDEDLIIVEGD